MPLSISHQLDLWREISHHLSIEAIAERVTGLLRQPLPTLSRLTIRRLDTGSGSVRTIACAQGEGLSLMQAWSMSPSEIPDPWMGAAEGFCRAGAAIWVLEAQEKGGWLGAMLPEAMRCPAWVAPLLPGGDTPPAILIIEFQDPAPDETREETGLHTLIDPLAVALENDWRLQTIESLRSAAEARNQQLLRRFGRDSSEVETDTVIGEGGGLRSVFERVAMVSSRDLPIMLLGETGSGKEVIAKAIHERSARTGKPFIRVNCGAIAPELVDSELFGHERGSFTGAIGQRRGWFEQADQGTLFLDEVGELPKAAQVRLLRVVQEGVLTRVGGESPVHVNVRIVSATHRDLAALVREGNFREDLWYRLAVFPILLPPLRERPQDLPELAAHFARRAATRFCLTPCPPTARELAELGAYDWPGNVRELQSVIERAALLGNGQGLDLDRALGLTMTRQGAGHVQAQPSGGETAEESENLDVLMRRHMAQVLRRCGGRIEGPGGAAQRMGIQPNTLRARMRKLGVDWRSFRMGVR